MTNKNIHNHQFLLRSDKKMNDFVRNRLLNLKKAILQRTFNKKSLFLFGSFMKGEGSAGKIDGQIILLSDFDFLILTYLPQQHNYLKFLNVDIMSVPFYRVNGAYEFEKMEWKNAIRLYGSPIKIKPILFKKIIEKEVYDIFKVRIKKLASLLRKIKSLKKLSQQNELELTYGLCKFVSVLGDLRLATVYEYSSSIIEKKKKLETYFRDAQLTKEFKKCLLFRKYPDKYVLPWKSLMKFLITELKSKENISNNIKNIPTIFETCKLSETLIKRF